ncbi:MAG: hypothetical protein LBP35_01160, partial [Candidatus Ancillula trichonymphae]|nr:hypothetical protein [Candidatus Ancillula trichonymphae]
MEQLTCNPPTKVGFTLLVAGYEVPVKKRMMAVNVLAETAETAECVLVYDKNLKPIANVYGYTNDGENWINADSAVQFRAAWAQAPDPAPTPDNSGPGPTGPQTCPSGTHLVDANCTLENPTPARDASSNSGQPVNTGVAAVFNLFTLSLLLMLSGLGLTMRKKLNSTKLNSAEMRTAKFLRNIIVARRCA